MEIPGIGLELAEKLYSGGYSSPEELKEISAEELSQLEGINEEEAQVIINAASQIPPLKDAEDDINGGAENLEDSEDNNPE
jgi:N utilization substance protein A